MTPAERELLVLVANHCAYGRFIDGYPDASNELQRRAASVSNSIQSKDTPIIDPRAVLALVADLAEITASVALGRRENWRRASEIHDIARRMAATSGAPERTP